MQSVFKNTYFFLVLINFGFFSCNSTAQHFEKSNLLKSESHSKKITTGAANTTLYLPLIQNKKVAVICNQGSVITRTNGQYTHLLDSLLQLNINIEKIFTPEHGFRGTADAGEKIKNEKVADLSATIISLYGENYKPRPEQLQNIDIILFDLQDVGVRFYTYISTLHYVMEAASEAKKPIIVLDRPNPNAHYIDGPVLNPKFSSFVGMHPVPVVYGMTIGEYAQMINGEKWLKNGITADLTVIKNENYNHRSVYELPVKPSPNLPNSQAINLYPSLCFFEGTNVSCGRGTALQFQIYGSPYLPKSLFDFSFTPKPNTGAKNPMHNGKLCFGENLVKHEKLSALKLTWLQKTYQNTADKSIFFNDFFNKLAGNDVLKNQIIKGLNTHDIRKTWQKDLDYFKKIRAKYLLYDE